MKEDIFGRIVRLFFLNCEIIITWSNGLKIVCSLLYLFEFKSDISDIELIDERYKVDHHIEVMPRFAINMYVKLNRHLNLKRHCIVKSLSLMIVKSLLYIIQYQTQLF